MKRDPLSGPTSTIERIKAIPESEWRPRLEDSLAETRAHNAREDALYEQRAAERAAQLEAERRAQVDARAADLKAFARERFMLTPGSTSEGFEEAWPDILRAFQVREVTAAVNAPVATMVEELREMRRRQSGQWEAGMQEMVETG